MKLFIAAELSINIARGLFTLALGMMLYQATDSLWAFALTFVSEFFVAIFLQGLAGSLVDRVGAVRVMGAALLVSTAGLLAAFFLAAQQSASLLIALAILLNIARPFIRNAVFALTPQVVSEAKLEKLNGLISIALQLGQMVGMALAGFILEWYSAGFITFATFGGYLLASGFYFTLFAHLRRRKSEHREEPAEPAGWSDVGAFVAKHPRIRVVLACAAVDYMAIAVFNLLLAPAVREIFAGRERWLSFIDIAFAIGALTGGLLIAKKTFSDALKYRVSLLSTACAMGVFGCYFFRLPAPVLLGVTSLFGFMVTLSTVFWLSEIQRDTPAAIRGRVGSLRYIANSVGVILGTSLVSLANDRSFDLALLAAISVMAAALASVAVFGHRASPVARWLSRNSHKLTTT